MADTATFQPDTPDAEDSRLEPAPSMRLEVTIMDVRFTKPHNYFVVLTLDEGLKGNQQANLRTEVCADITDHPRFSTESSKITMDVVDDFVSKDANLKGGGFRVSKEGGGGVALEGNVVIPLRPHMADLSAGKAVSVEEAFMSEGENGQPVQVGTLKVDILLTDPTREQSPAQQQQQHQSRPGGREPELKVRATVLPSAQTPASLQPPQMRLQVQQQPEQPAQSHQPRQMPARSPVAVAAPAPTPPPAVDGSPFRVVTMVVRHAINLPPALDAATGQPVSPTPFVAIKSARDAAARRPARSSTTAVRNSRHPIWNQTLVAEVLQEDLDRGDGAIIVTIINHDTKRRIAQVAIPAHKLVPSEQYNLDIQLFRPQGSSSASPSAPANSRLYLSATLHDSTMGEKTLLLANPHLTRLEVLVKGFALGRPLPYGADETVGVVRLVPDAAAYVERVTELQHALARSQPLESAGIIAYPLEQYQRAEDDRTQAHTLSSRGLELSLPMPSAAQLTAAVGPGDTPAWNQTLYFTYPTAELYAEGAALLVEVFQRGLHSPENGRRQLGRRSGAEEQLSADGLRRFCRADTDAAMAPPELFIGYVLLPLVQLFRSAAGSKQTTRTMHVLDDMALTLIATDEGKLGFGAGTKTSAIPNEVPSVHPWLQLEIRSWSAAALSMTAAEAAKELREAAQSGDAVDTSKDLPAQDPLVERLLQDIEEKKDVIRRCGVEIIELRRQCGIAAQEHIELRTALAQEQTRARAVVGDGSGEDVDELTRSELLLRTRTLRHKVDAEHIGNEQLLKKLSMLESAVENKNMTEDKLRELEEAHSAQSNLVRELQNENAKVQHLRGVVKEQESVVVHLEELVGSAQKQRKKLQAKLDNSAVHLRIGAEVDGGEARRLSAEIDEVRARREAIESRTKEILKTSFELRKASVASGVDEDKDELLMRAQHAETKADSLDEQLLRNARKFLDEISDLKDQLERKNLQLPLSNSGKATHVPALNLQAFQVRQ